MVKLSAEVVTLLCVCDDAWLGGCCPQDGPEKVPTPVAASTTAPDFALLNPTSQRVLPGVSGLVDVGLLHCTPPLRP